MNTKLNINNKNSQIIGTKVYLMSAENTMETIWLPKQTEGRFYFKIHENDEIYDFFYIEGDGERWNVHCKNGAYLYEFSDNQFKTELVDRQFKVINYFQREYAIYSETLIDGSNINFNYKINGAQEIRIGREADNDIQYDEGFVSRHHATLWWNRDHWTITDNDSSNGTYVNGVRIREISVRPSDVIYIAGLRIVVGFDFLSINTMARKVHLNKNVFSELIPDSEPLGVENPAIKNPDEHFYNRAPRRRESMTFNPIDIESPPMSMNSNQIPLLLRMGGSAVMGGRALAAGQVTMLLSSFIFPLLVNRYSEKEKKEYEGKRKEMYTKYLEQKRKEIKQEKENEFKALNSNYPPLDTVLNYPISGKRLWERQRTDDDFLTLRVGYGRLPLQAELEYADKRFSIEEDPLETEMYRMCEEPVFLENAPVLSSFADDWVCGVQGDRNEVLKFIQNMIMQLTILHSYDDVKTVFLIDSKELDSFNFIRYLPHVWNNQRNFRFLATNISEVYKIGEYLKKEIEEDLACEQSQKSLIKIRTRPYYFIFALDKKLFDSIEIIKDVIKNEYNIGVSVVAAFGDIPKECTKVFQINNNLSENEIIYIKQLERENNKFKLDKYEEAIKENSLKHLFNTNLRIVSNNYTLPKTITFLEMFGVGRVEHLNIIDRWNHSNPIKSLATPVGVGVDGNQFVMDLHEKFQGPHGLVAGMTGSGKSEFLITYILSLAVNYHPDEVAFILIDYKGGGLADAFENKSTGVRLPHLMGTITNLDGSSIQRSLMAIESELKRRQRTFKECKEKLDESTMDIYSYQKLYRLGKVREPMPHLFIISDEFAELKQQQPEFMDQLISIARIGRSLGVHLILATQKPSGVVNDQIRSNTKFRVCLKVQDKSDSMDMLKRHEAAELVDTGRFYMQVGYNEYFAIGQSAWCGAQYEPQDEVIEKKDDSIYVLDFLGQPTLTISPKPKHINTEKSQLAETVKHLSDIAYREHIKTRLLWTDPLLDVIDAGNYPIRDTDNQAKGIFMGILDDPENQRQIPLIYDFQHCGNLMIVGDTASGKTTLIQTILYSLAKKCSPDEFQFYALDYSSRLLKTFTVLPHCGEILTEEDSASLDGFFEIINVIVSERKKLFADMEVNNYDDASAIKKLPLVLVVIDGFAGLNNSKEGLAHLQKIHTYLRDSVNYGVKYIISCTHLNELSARIKQELGDRICLHLKDKFEYGDALSCKVLYTPPEKPGRGLYKFADSPLELQCAMYSESESNLKYFKERLRAVCENTVTSTMAVRLPKIPENETFEEFSKHFKLNRIPIGYALKTGQPVAMPFKQISGLSLYFGNEAGIAPSWNNFVQAAEMNGMDLIVVKQKSGSLVNTGEFKGIAKIVECQNECIISLWKELTQLIVDRKKLAAEYCETAGFNPNSSDSKDAIFDYMIKNTTPIMLIIENFEEFCAEVDEASEKVFDQLLKMARQYNIYPIGAFYPTTNAGIRFKLLYKALNVDENLLMFGGRTSDQPFGKTDLFLTQNNKKLPYNYCIMQYKNNFYELSIPCGELTGEEIDEDDRNIF